MKISRLITAAAVTALIAGAPAAADASTCVTSTIGAYKVVTCTADQSTDSSYGTGSYGTGSYGTGSYGTGSYGTGSSTDSYGTGNSTDSYGTG